MVLAETSLLHAFVQLVHQIRALIRIAALKKVGSAALIATRVASGSVAVTRSEGNAAVPLESLVAQQMS